MQEWLITLSDYSILWVYPFIILIAIIEGPVLSMVFGILIRLGHFPLIPIYITLMFGDLVGDMIWYFVGRKWGEKFVRKYGKYVSVDDSAIHTVKNIFHTHSISILVLSKMTNGFGFSFATLITAGMVRISFYKYFWLNFIGQIVWTGVLLAIGYYFSYAYLELESIVGKLFVVLLFVALLVAFFGFSKFVHNKFKKIP